MSIYSYTCKMYQFNRSKAKILKIIPPLVLDVHCAAHAHNTCLTPLWGSYRVLACYFHQKVSLHCLASFSFEEAQEGVAMLLLFEFVQILKHMTNETDSESKVSRSQDAYYSKITHQILQEIAQSNMKREAGFLHEQSVVLPSHNFQEHIPLEEKSCTQNI